VKRRSLIAKDTSIQRSTMPSDNAAVASLLYAAGHGFYISNWAFAV
jgi:hypothetical protein